MNRLIAELQRLYFIPEVTSPDLGFVSADGRTRVAVLGFERAAGWSFAARLHRAVQEELEFPPAAVSIAGSGGYRLWFSLGAPVTVERAGEFLNFLRRKYLGDMPPGQLKLWPDDQEDSSAELPPLIFPPAFDARSGKWSAFIEPDLGSMFVEEPGLDMTPNEERQADLLSGLESIRPDVFQNVLAGLRPQPEVDGDASLSGMSASPTDVAVTRPLRGLSLGGGFTDPKSFLLAVMNDPAASAEHRIDAAKALLPYFDGER